MSDSFDGKVKHARDGNIWIFNRDVIESLAKEDNSRIKVTGVNRQENGEGVKAVNTPAEGGP